jgi:hypothetical protein
VGFACVKGGTGDNNAQFPDLERHMGDKPNNPIGAMPESRQVVEIPWGLSPGVAGADRPLR